MSVLYIKEEKLHWDMQKISEATGKKLYALAEEAVRDLIKKYQEGKK